MKVFLTGTAGWRGSHLLPELVKAGHQVTVLSLSELSDARIRALGATPLRGSPLALDVLKSGAEGVDAVIHEGDYQAVDKLDPDEMREADKAGVLALASGLKKGGIFIQSHCCIGLALKRVLTEDDDSEQPDIPQLSRPPLYNKELKARGLIPIHIRLPPAIYGQSIVDSLPEFIMLAQEHGFVGVVEDGTNRWPAIHAKDFARVIRLAMEKGEAGIYHGVAEEGVAAKDMCRVIAKGLGVPVRRLSFNEAMKHYASMNLCALIDWPVSNKITKRKLGFEPSQPGLLEYLANTNIDIDYRARATISL